MQGCIQHSPASAETLQGLAFHAVPWCQQAVCYQDSPASISEMANSLQQVPKQAADLQASKATYLRDILPEEHHKKDAQRQRYHNPVSDFAVKYELFRRHASLTRLRSLHQRTPVGQTMGTGTVISLSEMCPSECACFCISASTVHGIIIAAAPRDYNNINSMV